MDNATLNRLEKLYKDWSVLPYNASGGIQIDDVDLYVKILERVYEKQPFWKVLLIDLMTKIDIWQWDENGQIKIGDNGYPKINVMKLMFNLGKVISYLLVLIAKSDIPTKDIKK